MLYLCFILDLSGKIYSHCKLYVNLLLLKDDENIRKVTTADWHNCSVVCGEGIVPIRNQQVGFESDFRSYRLYSASLVRTVAGRIPRVMIY